MSSQRPGVKAWPASRRASWTLVMVYSGVASMARGPVTAPIRLVSSVDHRSIARTNAPVNSASEVAREI